MLLPPSLPRILCVAAILPKNACAGGCVYTHPYIHIYIYTYIYTHTHMQTCSYRLHCLESIVQLSLCKKTPMREGMCMYAYIHTNIHMHVHTVHTLCV